MNGEPPEKRRRAVPVAAIAVRLPYNGQALSPDSRFLPNALSARKRTWARKLEERVAGMSLQDENWARARTVTQRKWANANKERLAVINRAPARKQWQKEWRAANKEKRRGATG